MLKHLAKYKVCKNINICHYLNLSNYFSGMLHFKGIQYIVMHAMHSQRCITASNGKPLSSSFAYNSNKLVGKRKRRLFLHTLSEESILKNEKLVYHWNINKKWRKTNPKRRRKNFVFSGSSFFAFCLHFNKNELLSFLNGPFRQCERRPSSFSFFWQDWLNYKQKTKKIKERGLPPPPQRLNLTLSRSMKLNPTWNAFWIVKVLHFTCIK